LARRDGDTARAEADFAHLADPTLPLPTYVEARLLYDQGKYVEALPLFERAIVDLKNAGGPPMVDWHYYIADTLARLERDADAEAELLEELRLFPSNTRARTGLATLYHRTGRTDEAVDTLAALVRITPTPEAYSLSTRLLTSFGKRQQAERLRADARKIFARQS
jgi:tetratricopeptide (TPR) repeat protein